MGNTTILQLPQANGLTGTEQIEGVQSGTSVRIPLSGIAALGVGPRGPVGPVGPPSLPAASAAGQVPVSNSTIQGDVTFKSTPTTTYFAGAFFDGVHDDSAAIQSALNVYSASNRGRLIFPAGVTAKINSGLTITQGVQAVDFNGAKLDATGMTSGYALSVIPDGSGPPFGRFSVPFEIANFNLLGNIDNESNPTDGLFLGRLTGSGQVSGLTLRNFNVIGFRDGMYWGNQVYINSIFNGNVTSAWRYGLNYVGSVNAGENMNWHGGQISNCRNAGGTAIGIFIPPNGNNDLMLHGVSVDYNDVAMDIDGSLVFLSGCHIEGNNQNPFVKLRQSTSNYTMFSAGSSAWAPTENAPGRPWLIECVQGDQISVNTVGSLFYLFNSNAEVIHVTAGNPHINYGGAFYLATGLSGNQPKISLYTNGIYNGDASGLGTAGWTSSGTGTFSNNAGTGVTGNSLRWVGTGASGTIFQDLGIKPGQLFLCEGFWNLSVLTGGTVVFQLQFYDATGVQITNFNAVTVSATTTGYVKHSQWRRAPVGARYARVNYNFASFNGTIDIDDVKGWVY